MRLLLLLLLSLTATAQTTVWLRYGTPGNFSKITNATQATPIVITTSAAHGFSNGDHVWIQGVYGNWNANGHRKVKNVTSTTFEITDQNDTNIVGAGVFVSGLSVGARAGIVQEYTLKGRPRLMLDGPGGTLTTKFADPSVKAVTGWTPWDALVTTNDRDQGYVLAAGDTVGVGDIIHKLALGWFMDNSRTSWRDNATRLVKRFATDELNGTSGVNFAPSPFTASTHSRGSDVDWASFQQIGYLSAYDLGIRDQMTEGERQTFRDQILNDNNDYGESCTNPITDLTGTASTVAGTTTVTGTGTNFTTDLSVGSIVWLYYRSTTQTALRAPHLTRVNSIASATSFTMQHTAPFTEGNIMIRVARAWQAGDCGWRWYTRGHTHSPQMVDDRRRMTFTLTSSIDSSTTSIPVSFVHPKTYPYWIWVSQAGQVEYMKVTGAVGSNLTVVRGEWNSAPAAWPSGRLIYIGDPKEAFGWGGDRAVPHIDGMPYDDAQNNLTIQKLQGNLYTGIALADEDERARKLVEQTYNYWFDYTLPFNKRTWSFVNQSANEIAYNIRQYGGNLAIALMMKNSFTPSIDLTGGEWLKTNILHAPWTQLPGYTYQIHPFSDVLRRDFLPRHVSSAILGAATFPTSPEAKRFFWWLKNKMNQFDVADFTHSADSSMLLNALFLPSPNETPIEEVNMETTDLPDYAKYTADLEDTSGSFRGENITPFGTWHTRSDWTATATSIYAWAMPLGTDHVGSYPGAGVYKIAKGQIMLSGDEGGNNHNSSSFRHVTNSMAVRPELGNDTSNLSNSRGSIMDKHKATAEYGYTRVNASGAYNVNYAVTRAHRHLLHVKGDADVFIHYDNVVTSTAYTRRLRYHTYSEYSEIPTWSRTDCKAVHTRPTSNARLVVQFTGTGFTCSEVLPAMVSGRTHNKLVADFPATTQNGMFVVSKAFGNTSGDVADIAAIGTISSSHEGVEIPSLDVVAAMPKNGTTTSTSLTYTTAAAATHYVGGMTAGEYVVSVGGDAVSPNPTVDGENLLVFTSASTGAVSIVKTDATAPLEITTASIANPQVGVAYSTTLAGSGGTPPYSWSATGVPAGLSLSSAGVLSGTPTTAGPYTIAVTLTDDVSATANRNIPVTVSAETPPSITLSLTPLTLTFIGSEGGANPANQTLTFTSNYAIANWSRAINYIDGSGWLTVTPTSGTTAANLTVAADTTSLTVGTYCADVVVSSTDPAVTNSPRTSRVCVNVLAALTPPVVEYPASLRVTLGSVVDLNFTVEAGTGTGDITWTVTGDMPFGVAFADNGDNTATISGTARDIGRWPFTITATDENDETGQYTGAVEVVLPTEVAGIELTPKTFGGGVVLTMRKPGLDANLNCRAVLRVDPGNADPTTYVQDVTVGRGPAVRKFYFTGVLAGDHVVEAMCRIGDGVTTVTYYTNRIPVTVPAVAGGDGTYSVAFTPPAGRGITHARLRYRPPEGAFTNTTPAACTSAAPCALTFTAAKGLYEVQRQYCSNSDCSTVVPPSSNITEQIVQ